MKTQIFLVICLLCLGAVYAQFDTQITMPSESLDSLVKGMRKLEEGEDFGKKWPTFVYGPDLQLLQGRAVKKVVRSGQYIQNFYVDENRKVRVCVLQPPNLSNHLSTAGSGFVSVGPTTSQGNSLTVVSDAWQGQRVSSFSTTDIHGKPISLKKLEGKISVLHFWFVHSKPSTAEFPALNRLAQEYKGNPNVEFVSFALDPPERLTPFLKQNPLQYRVVPNAGTIAQNKFGVGPTPTHMIVDQQGVIRFVVRGESPNVVDKLKLHLSQLHLLTAANTSQMK